MHLHLNKLFTIVPATLIKPGITGMFSHVEHISPRDDVLRLAIYEDNKMIAVHETKIKWLVKHLRESYNFTIHSIYHEKA